MCGIIACAGEAIDDPLDVLLTGLSNLEYRGYDSAGVALAGEDLAVRKRAGELDRLRDAVAEDPPDGDLGIGHTRWSTHGPPTDANAHPHADCTGRVAVVHNGIIENYHEVRERLVDTGHEFTSETDTEVVAHLVEEGLDNGRTPGEAFREAIDAIEGSYAIAAVFAEDDVVYAARSDSPLVLGIGDGATYLASDVPAFREFTDRVAYLEDGHFVRLDAGGWTVTDAAGRPVEVEQQTVDWDPERTGKGGYEHYMLKEIHEQPRALRDGLRGRVDELNGRVVLDDLEAFAVPSNVQLVGCGTSYHAALFGASRIRALGIPASAHLASEYAVAVPPIEDDTLVIGVTQSGETADTLQALREARARSGRVTTLAVTNVVGSTAARECDRVLYIRSGPEIGVAATKTFASQLLALTLLTAGRLGPLVGAGPPDDLVASLRDLPDQVQSILDATDAPAVAETYADADAYFFIGRNVDATVALEGALKMKEITYAHAEGFAAGELKHGPLALVTDRTPVFAILTGDGEPARKTVGNVKEVEARGAPVVAVTDGHTPVERYADDVLRIPATHPQLAPILANVQLQLVAYHTAAALGRSIDRPRHLAKSVTVE